MDESLLIDSSFSLITGSLLVEPSSLVQAMRRSGAYQEADRGLVKYHDEAGQLLHELLLLDFASCKE